MLTTLALAAAFATPHAQGGALALSNVRVTQGSQYGPPRTDNKFPPGDMFSINFDIENLKANEKGECTYAVSMEVTGEVAGAGRQVIYKQPPTDVTAILLLGGNRLPAFAIVALPSEIAPGAISCKVIVTDKQANLTQTLERQFEILPKAFGIIGLFSTIDARGEIPIGTTGFVGQSVFLHFAVAAFDRDAKKKPNIQVLMTIYDEAGRVTTPKPIEISIVELDDKFTGAPCYYFVPFNRVGRFTVKLSARDLVSNRAAEATVPILVLDQPK